MLVVDTETAKTSMGLQSRSEELKGYGRNSFVWWRDSGTERRSFEDRVFQMYFAVQKGDFFVCEEFGVRFGKLKSY
jgi:hypothetical protein